ncbi:tRNA (adenosine(37)-N6)-threonylcarbamoyltransferase complex transferase subunit TsaD [Enterobacteriaceae endosymbiont of Donacia versicolorea]|uniref:tRNA (adenosine(37)-N6)-threonylcarbamoyltransferase complex transferase subunit TsaD n=1 Tax=Enterobacteriaceae endosymbiont of Donacia versicolorea TaxID=2675788 RepID=UPI001449ECD0|nr:tRNA (adenosine(37)-N6)-threonylcarbamoyltransferase complex transferase subunit TsaD [Enterobacteriaceae endosymbiont of Donacia versicolorea]QJC32097.1 tRNA (adenosine(37)-N6)-threonylcarbamoyltransferase complex transferase subunit TsaD [Enterobacteriaceae endosymbiont of Donacia versicolorea]
MLIMGIETSCDDTSVAIYDKNIGILCNNIYTQKIHSKYGGVVPELAARYHFKKLIPLIKKSLRKINKNLSNIDCIAYTAGPGQKNSLIIGAIIAHSLGYSLNIPVIPVNHMEGHLFSIMLQKKKPNFPFIGLLISGGHTQLVYVYKFGIYKLLGTNIDDAVGEAFDKTSKILGLNYPGGKNLSKLAKYGIPKKFIFPKPMTSKKNNLDFSFSGLKTFVKNFIKKKKLNNFQFKADVARAFEDTIIETLYIKSLWALKKYNINQLVIAGGVSSNKKLRIFFKKNLKKNKIKLFYSNIKLCTDNAAMIAYIGSKNFILKKKEYIFGKIKIDSKLSFNK